MSADQGSGDSTQVAVESLLRELAARDQLDLGSSADGTDVESTGRPDVFATARESPFTDPVQFETDLVRRNLDETLLALLALRQGGLHGGGLIEELEARFGASIIAYCGAPRRSTSPRALGCFCSHHSATLPSS
jgi:hypothetical protein